MLSHVYKIVSPECKTIKEFKFSSDELVPNRDEYATINNTDYKVHNVANEINFDTKSVLHVIYLDNIEPK